jgi:Flp pilus assembly protein TadD
MINQEKASQLAKAGFDLWQAGQLDESVAKYQEALECADPDHYALDSYHGEFAAVLETLGRDVEAREQYELALAEAQRQDKDGTGSGVSVARYFLAEQLLKMGDAAKALVVVQTVSGTSPKQEWLLRTVAAKALWDLGRRAESKDVAASAVTLAPKKENVRDHLAFILDAPAG